MRTSITTYNKLTKIFKAYCTLATSFLLALFITSTFFPVEGSSAITCNDGTTENEGEICDTAGTSVTVNIENPAYLTITSTASSSSGGSGGISLDYTKEDSPNLGSLITASDTVTTTSNTGQTKYLYISTSFNSSTTESNRLTNSDTDLSNDKTFIPAGGGDTLAGATALSDNTWGFSLAETNTNSEVFTKVPTLNNEMLISEDTGTFNDDTNDYVSTQNIYYGAIATSDLYAGEYSNTIKYTAFTDEPVVLTHYMQDFTIQDCNNLKTSTATEDHRITLIDKRDNKPYKVSRLADGNCWMVENLALDGTDEKTGEARVLHPSDSNVTEDRTLAPNATSGTSLSEVKIYSQYANNTTSACDFGSVPYCVVSDAPYGNLYNWYAATATVGTTSVTAGDVYESVCPKSWRLPSNGDNTVNKSWSKLLNDIGIGDGSNVSDSVTSGDYTKRVQLTPLTLSLAGSYDGNYSRQAAAGFYWSCTTYNGNDAYDFRFWADNGDFHLFRPQANNYKSNGFSVRCILGE